MEEPLPLEAELLPLEDELLPVAEDAEEVEALSLVHAPLLPLLYPCAFNAAETEPCCFTRSLNTAMSYPSFFCRSSRCFRYSITAYCRRVRG